MQDLSRKWAGSDQEVSRKWAGRQIQETSAWNDERAGWSKETLWTWTYAYSRSALKSLHKFKRESQRRKTRLKLEEHRCAESHCCQRQKRYVNIRLQIRTGINFILAGMWRVPSGSDMPFSTRLGHSNAAMSSASEPRSPFRPVVRAIEICIFWEQFGLAQMRLPASSVSSRLGSLDMF